MKIIALLFFSLWLGAGVSRAQETTDTPGWLPLFGTNLEKAAYNPEAWQIQNGVLFPVKDECIWTQNEYENFELDIEFKTDTAAHGGILVYCIDSANWIANSLKIQIADDHNEKWSKSNPDQQCGAIYNCLAARQQKIVKQPGEWNHMRIRCKGRRISVILNGKKTNEMQMDQWVSGTKKPDGRDLISPVSLPLAQFSTKGYIGLQGKQDRSVVWFRNLKIRAIKIQ